jgi:hypothetical protein
LRNTELNNTMATTKIAQTTLGNLALAGDSNYAYRAITRGTTVQGARVRRVATTYAADAFAAYAIGEAWHTATVKHDEVSGGPLAKPYYTIYDPVGCLVRGGFSTKNFALDAEGNMYDLRKVGKVAAKAPAKVAAKAPAKAPAKAKVAAKAPAKVAAKAPAKAKVAAKAPAKVAAKAPAKVAPVAPVAQTEPAQAETAPTEQQA